LQGVRFFGYPLYPILLLEGEEIEAKERESFSKKEHLNFLICGNSGSYSISGLK
jgi:hypothetical protein